MPTRPNDNWSLIDSCRETTRGEFTANAKICLGRSGHNVRARKKRRVCVYVCVKLSYTRPHETAVADNWSAVATVIVRNRLPSISVSASSGKRKAFNSRKKQMIA